MMNVRYTDSHKYPHGYRTACDTDIASTFARIRLQQGQHAAGTRVKVEALKPYIVAKAA